MNPVRPLRSAPAVRSALLAAAVTLSAWSTTALAADTPVAVSALPAAVTAAVQEYFPGATVSAAQRSTEAGRADEYELDLAYKAIRLEADISPDGRILDLDLKKR